MLGIIATIGIGKSLDGLTRTNKCSAMLNPSHLLHPGRQHALRRAAEKPTATTAQRAGRLLPPVVEGAAPSRSRSACRAGCGDSVAVAAPTTTPSSAAPAAARAAPAAKPSPQPKRADARTARRARTPSGSFTSAPNGLRTSETAPLRSARGSGRIQSSSPRGFLLPCSTGEPEGVRP